jgi:hypothetical protein
MDELRLAAVEVPYGYSINGCRISTGYIWPALSGHPSGKWRLLFLVKNENIQKHYCIP